MADVTPEATDRLRALRWSVGLVWFLPVGLVSGIATLFEGSYLWSYFGAVSVCIGIAHGSTEGDQLLEQVKRGEGIPVTARDTMRGMFSLKTILRFWLPQFLYIGFGMILAASLATSEFSYILMFLQSFTMYCCYIGSAWYKPWRWSRTPQ